MIFKDKFLKNNALMFFTTSIVNLANLFYQMFIIRKLTVTDYGIFNSLFSTFSIFTFPLASLMTMTAKFTASYNNTGERKKADFLILIILKHMFFIGLLFGGLYIILAPLIKNYLQLDSILPVYFIGIMLFFMIFSAVLAGGLQGLEKFSWFSISTISHGLFKVALVVLFISLGWNLLGALGAYLIAQIITTLICLFSLREIFSLKENIPGMDLKEKYKFVLPSLITLGCIALLTNIDIILVKHFFEPASAGHYSVAQFIGKIVLFIPGAVYLVMLPAASGLHAQQKDPRFVLIKSLKYTAALCLFVVALYNIFPILILNLLTGKAGSDTIFLGRLFSITMTFFSLVVVLLLYHISISRLKFLKILVLFTTLQILAILIFHASLVQVLLIMFSNSVALFILSLISALKN